MVGTTEYLNFTAFLRMLFSSKMKLGSGLALIYLTFFGRRYLIAALLAVHQGSKGSICLFCCSLQQLVQTGCDVSLL